MKIPALKEMSSPASRSGRIGDREGRRAAGEQLLANVTLRTSRPHVRGRGAGSESTRIALPPLIIFCGFHENILYIGNLNTWGALFLIMTLESQGLINSSALHQYDNRGKNCRNNQITFLLLNSVKAFLDQRNQFLESSPVLSVKYNEVKMSFLDRGKEYI
jgi:hypothetical protein